MTLDNIFTRACTVEYRLPHYRCPSVCPSHSGILSKRTCFLHWRRFRILKFL